MKIVVKLDDGYGFQNRIKNLNTDLCVVVRPGKNGKLETAQIWPENTDLQKVILQADDVHVEFIGHSSRGSKTVQSDATPKYPTKITVGIDKLAHWMETDLIPKSKMPETKITMSCCEGANDTKKYASMAEQFLRLFHNKPKQLVARKGFVYVDKKLHSHGHFTTALYQLTKHKAPINKSTPTGERFVFIYSKKNKQYYKIDSHLHTLFNFLKKENIADQKILDILSKDIENIPKKDFKKLVTFALTNYKKGRIHEKANILNKGTIINPILLHGNTYAFDIRDGLNVTIQQLLQANKNKSKHNKEIIDEILKATQQFINYRTERNYNLNAFPRILSIMTNIIELQKGKFSEKDIKALRSVNAKIVGNTRKDSAERFDTIGLRPPGQFAVVKKLTKSKNTAYAEVITNLVNNADKYPTRKGNMRTQASAHELKIREEIFQNLQLNKEREIVIQGFPESVQHAYQLLDKEAFNVSFIWADMNKVNRDNILEITPNLRIMRNYLQEAREYIFAHPTNEGVNEALSMLKNKMDNALHHQPAFKKESNLSKVATKCKNHLSLFLNKHHNPEKAKEIKHDMLLEKRLKESHSEVKSLIKKHRR